jgi:hypothetical protein
MINVWGKGRGTCLMHLMSLLKPTWRKVDATWGEPFVGTFMEGQVVSSP